VRLHEVKATLVARAAGLDVPALLAAAAKEGLREQEYRDELRRQILEGKILELRARAVPGRDGWEAARDAWKREQRRRTYVDVRL
jgi:peptidyl-prolyl cis-trans isomerase SurA